MQTADNVITTHRKWVESQGIPVLSGFSIPNLLEVAVGAWKRMGAHGAYIALEGVEDLNDAYILELSPRGSVKPERHMYEKLMYVLSGRGATVVWNEGGAKCSFEWHEGGLFAIPVNAWHQFFNAQGDSPARLFVVSAAPLVMNLYHNIEFVFDNFFVFSDRFDRRKEFFSGQGKEMPGRLWETNFVEDIRTFPLLAPAMYPNFQWGPTRRRTVMEPAPMS